MRNIAAWNPSNKRVTMANEQTRLGCKYGCEVGKPDLTKCLVVKERGWEDYGDMDEGWTYDVRCMSCREEYGYTTPSQDDALLVTMRKNK